MKAKKIERLNKREGAPKASIVSDDEEEEAEETATVDTTLTAEGSVPVVEEIDDADVTGTPVASIPEGGTLDIVFLEELLDYPVIGQYNFLEQHGVSRIRRHQRFTVPRNVALTLLDKRLVTIPSHAV